MDKKAIIQALRDTAQSASNSAASNLSAPVDAITWALRKAGLNIPTPVGGSEWMEKKGLTAPVQEGIPKMAGDTLGGLAPIMAVAKAPQIAAGMNRMVDNAMAPATLGKQRGVVNLGSKYPIADKSQWYSHSDFDKTGGKITSMSPDEYISKVRPLDIDEVSRENIDLLKQHIQEGKTLDPLAIYPNGKEDGRHRAWAAKELGMSLVPVLQWGIK